MTAQRRDRAISSIGVWLLSAVLLVWTLLPIYNIIRVSIQDKEEVLSTSVYPIAPSPHAFSVVFRQAFWLLETFWNQMGNSFYIGIIVALLTLAIGSLTSFTISRMRMRLMVKLVSDPMVSTNIATAMPMKKLLPIWFQNVSSSQ